MHSSTFDCLEPTERQQRDMASLRMAARDYAAAITDIVPEGPDRTYIMRILRQVAMWADVAITRNPDGSPRQG